MECRRNGFLPAYHARWLLVVDFHFVDISSSSFIQFQVWDFPGQIDFFDPTFDADNIFGGQCEALIYIIDAQVSMNIRLHLSYEYPSHTSQSL